MFLERGGGKYQGCKLYAHPSQTYQESRTYRFNQLLPIRALFPCMSGRSEVGNARRVFLAS